jgi:hypothetical protein
MPEKHGFVAVKMAVGKNLAAVEGPEVAVVCGGGGSEGLSGPSNTVIPGCQLCRIIERMREERHDNMIFE